MPEREMDLQVKAEETLQHLARLTGEYAQCNEEIKARMYQVILFALEDVWDYAAEVYDRGRFR